MPSNFLTDYRQRLREFHTELNQEAYLFASGQKEMLEVKYLHSEYADLFALATRTELRKNLPLYRPTETLNAPRCNCCSRRPHMRISQRACAT